MLDFLKFVGFHVNFIAIFLNNFRNTCTYITQKYKIKLIKVAFFPKKNNIFFIGLVSWKCFKNIIRDIICYISIYFSLKGIIVFWPKLIYKNLTPGLIKTVITESYCNLKFRYTPFYPYIYFYVRIDIKKGPKLFDFTACIHTRNTDAECFGCLPYCW